jgi:hypothetical protein
MKLKELEELRNCNELDMLYKIIDKAEGIKKKTEQVIKGKKAPGVDVRKVLQDIRLLSEIMRDTIQMRKFNANDRQESKLEKAIESEQKRLIREEERIRKLEERRIVQR